MAFESKNPTTGELLNIYPEHSAQDVEATLAERLGRMEEVVAHSAF